MRLVLLFSILAALPRAACFSSVRYRRWTFSLLKATTSASETTKDRLLDLVSQTPRSSSTPQALTQEILQTVRELETQCAETRVVDKLPGVWELLWTTQDRSSSGSGSLSRYRWINPLENQAYSNNPKGRADPFLPRPLQDKLEELGLVASEPEIRSTQSIDLKSKQVRNVVSFSLGKKEDDPKKRLRASLTVTVDFASDPDDFRRINVKFQACRVSIPNTPINFVIPLGIIGPTGWLRTTYIDDELRITRGHKGSVFVLTRPTAATTASRSQ